MSHLLHTIKRGNRVLLIYEDHLEIQRGVSDQSDSFNLFSAPPDKIINLDDIVRIEVSDGYIHFIDDKSKGTSIKLFSARQDANSIYLGTQKSKKAKRVIDNLIGLSQ